MAMKLVIKTNTPSGETRASVEPLSAAEETDIADRTAAIDAESLRRDALTAEEMADEDIVQPMFDTAGGSEAKLIKAVALALLDGINQGRAARGAAPISTAQLRSAIQSKLGAM